MKMRESSVLQSLVNHIFLPRQLPQGEDVSGHIHQEMVSLVQDAVAEATQQLPSFPKTVKMLQGLSLVSRSPEPETIRNLVHGLKEGDMISFYVQAQNAGLTFSKENGSLPIVVSSFQASPSSAAVMSSDGDILIDFPENSVRVPESDLLTSSEFARSLQLLITTEFSEALPKARKAGHEFVETRDVADPMFVTDYVTSLLSSHDSFTDKKFPRIRKKIRDDVILGTNTAMPFRRSGMWTTIKVALQLSLIRELGEETGHFTYKCVTLLLMTKLLKNFHGAHLQAVDTKVQMMRKISRRLFKLSKAGRGEIMDKTFQKVHSIISASLLIVEGMISSAALAGEEASFINNIVNQLSNGMLQQDAIVSLQLSTKALLQDKKLDVSKPTGVPTPDCPDRRIDPVSFPSTENFSAAPHERDLELREVENWVRLHLGDFCHSEFCDHIKTLIDQYSRAALSHYQGDPVQNSRLILTVVKCVQILDKIAVSQYPLYANHNAGVPLKFLERLLLPQKEDMVMAQSVEEYFLQRQSSNRELPSIISETSPSTSSFPVRYAKATQRMEDLRTRIIEEMEHQIELKKAEVVRVRRECDELRRQLRLMTCEYRYDSYHEETRHSGSCSKCSTENWLERKLVSVSAYEKTLPDAKYLQQAIVFELLIPHEIAVLRDMLYYLNVDILGGNRSLPSDGIRCDWTYSDFVGSYSNVQSRSNMNLGSTTKSTSETHYGRKISVDNSESLFILNNGYNTVYHAHASAVPSVTSRCTFALPSKGHGQYGGLQWALEWISHSSNDMLSRQCECPAPLPMQEFQEFGSLRAGHRLQYRNIVHALNTGNLSLKEEEVFMLLCQAQWQYGQGSAVTGASWMRESHEDLLDPVFTKELLVIVDKMVDVTQKKWSDPYTLLCLITIAARALDLGPPEVQSVSAKLLRKCRGVGITWIDSMKKLLGKAGEASDNEKNSFKRKLTLAALAVTLCFNVSNEHGHLVMETGEDLSYWMEALTTIYNHIFWNFSARFKELGMTPVQRTLLRMVITTAIKLEPIISDMVVAGGKGLKLWIKQNWTDSLVYLKVWKKCAHPQIYSSTIRSTSSQTDHQLYVDVVFGRFLVDGYPLGTIPERIVRSPEYQRTFSRAEFDVQPSQIKGVKVFTTSKVYHDRAFRFYQMDGQTFVEEIGDKEELQLVPHGVFTSSFPLAFSASYSHWINSKTRKLYFREVEVTEKDFTEIRHIWDLQKNRMEEVESMRLLVGINHEIYKAISNVLKRIEPVEYIHVWQTKDGRLEVELTKLGLRFFLEDGILRSHEFPGFMVDRDQSLGSLQGLKNKLVLIQKKIDIDSPRKVIVPHGRISIHGGGDLHQTVNVALPSTKNPPFFVYDVDRLKRQLTGDRNQTAWIYLAALHGATASPLPDPFTGLTGTERAFQILQSARSWSIRPYEDDSLEIMETIAAFSPTRAFYPKHLKVQQRITWPSGLSPMCAHDGYRILVKELLKNANLFNQWNLFQSESEVDSGEKTNEIENEQSDLNLKHYWRNLVYENELSVIEALKTSPRPPASSYKRHQTCCRGQDVRELRHLCSTWTSCVTSNITFVRSLLVTYMELSGPSSGPADKHMDIVKAYEAVSHVKLRNYWFNAYKLAKEVGADPKLRNMWTLMLSFLVFRGEQLEHLRILHAVAVHWQDFVSLQAPQIASFSQPSASFNSSDVTSCARDSAIKFCGSGYSTFSAKSKAEGEHDSQVNNEVQKIANSVRDHYVPRQTSSIHLRDTYYYKIRVSEAEKKINQFIYVWYLNSLLDQFLEDFERRLQTAATKSISVNLSELEELPLPPQSAGKDELRLKLSVPISLHDAISEADIPEQSEAEAVYSQQSSDCQAFQFEKQVQFLTSFMNFRNKAQELWGKTVELLAYFDNNGQHLVASGLFPRLVPSTLLPVLTIADDLGNLVRIQSLIGAVSVYWTLERKMGRCIDFMRAGSSMQVALNREKETVGFKSFSPRKFPEWLLLELELNMNIRPMQVKVANAMMDPSNGSNSVLQLNMGEGKTALIVPMLVTALANGNQLCRVTVIKSIFPTNFNALRHTLGGLLNRRVYFIPCCRDVDFDVGLTENVLSALKDCMTQRGVLLSLPEYQLSFQLKGYELSRKGSNCELSRSLLKVQDWLNENTRDVLDESDEILSVKYQLIYTVGSQLPVGGGNLRWEIPQKLLESLDKVMLSLQRKHGEMAIEYQHPDPGNESVYPLIRLLSNAVYPELLDVLAQAFVDGKLVDDFSEIKTEQKSLLIKFLTNNSITEQEIQEMLDFEILKDSLKNQETLLILAGYMRFGVLESALSKRWRVNFGVNINQNSRKLMAVPFKAKDVAAERTEFGHPDMAIVLTLLSYYYSGLKDSQLIQCFAYLKAKSHENPSSEYARWIGKVPKEKLHDSVSQYEGVNLDDYEQRTQHLFPILRKSKTVIDFYLSKFVFPKESRQFEGKMTCTAWDLATESKRLLTTGFSGTNDTKRTLPALISQNDLPELQDTNKKLEEILLREENQYQSFAPDITSIGILKHLNESKIKVLLDCGALMLQLGNEQVAEKWLEIDSSLSAVVFFDKKGIITVKDRSARKNCPYELSPFRERLGSCGVYLDDEHTRGTDLKFPVGSRACVTLGSGLTRDKMVQACMRMRMLGNGHSVTFWASHEVNNKIASLTGVKESEIGSREVLAWVIDNSKKFEEDGMVYWASAAVNYCRKRAADDIYRKSGKANHDLKQLGLNCTEPEVLDLQGMYCHARNERLFTEIFPSWFKAARNCLIYEECPASSIAHLIKGDFDKIERKVYRRVNDVIPKKHIFSQLLDEEQEKEIEKETEQEEHRELPGRAQPYNHHLSREVEMTVRSGQLTAYEDNSHILSIASVFRETTICEILEEECWGKKVFCTSDFIQTVTKESVGGTLTEFLRPVTWVVLLQKGNLLVISPFEANALIQSFRERKFKSTLALYNPRTLPCQELLLDNPRLRVPSSNQILQGQEGPDASVLSSLFLCSGNLYFRNNEEEEAFSKSLGLIPSPREESFQQHFDTGKISPQNGFVAKDHRTFQDCPIPMSVFRNNPEELVVKICRIRNQSFFPKDSHVARLVVNGKRNFE